MSEKAPQIAYERGDTVYAHTDGGPLILKVLASGKDGFTGETETGERHKLTHDRYLGHQKRVKHSYRVADQGEDGCLVEDESGNRLFVAGGLPEAPEGKRARDNAHRFSTIHTEDHKLGPRATLIKALDLSPRAALPQGMALLLKADDKGAVRPVKTKKKPTGPARHRHGDYVAFRHEDVEGRGRIIGSGQDGVTIFDEETGREHLIRHDALLPEHPEDPSLISEDKEESEEEK